MEITPTSFRILKFLNSNKIELFTENNLINKLRINNGQKVVDSIQELQLLNLAGGGRGNVCYKLEGEKYYNNIIKQINELIYNDAIEDYDYAILKFLHNYNWGVKEEEFPSILKQKCPIEIFADYLYQQRINIKSDKDSNYSLTSEGEDHYYLETKRKDSTKEDGEKSKINFLQIGTNSGIINQGSDLKEVQQSTGSSSQKMNVSAPAKAAIINKIIIGVFIGVMILLVGHYVFGIG